MEIIVPFSILMACVFANLILQTWHLVSPRPLFDRRDPETGEPDDRFMIAQLGALLGPPSSEFRRRSPVCQSFWDEIGNQTALMFELNERRMLTCPYCSREMDGHCPDAYAYTRRPEHGYHRRDIKLAIYAFYAEYFDGFLRSGQPLENSLLIPG